MVAKAIIGTTLDDLALEALAKAAEVEAKPISDKRGNVSEFRSKRRAPWPAGRRRSPMTGRKD